MKKYTFQCGRGHLVITAPSKRIAKGFIRALAVKTNKPLLIGVNL
jgi:hypothetical protein